MKVTLVILACLLALGGWIAALSMARGPRVQVQGPRVPAYREPQGPHVVQPPRPGRGQSVTLDTVRRVHGIEGPLRCQVGPYQPGR